MASRLELKIVEVLKDPIPLPPGHAWTDEDTFDARDPAWWVGSREPCALIIAHSTVSRAQFLIRPGDNGRFFVRNLGSYGTYVDGVHLKEDDEAELKNRSTIRAGAVYFNAVTIGDPDLPSGNRFERATQEPRESSPWDSDDSASVNVWGAWGIIEETAPEPPPATGTKRRTKSPTTDPGLARDGHIASQPADDAVDRILAAAGLPAAQRALAAGLVTPEDIGKMLAAWVKGARSVQFVKREIKETHRLEATTSLEGSVNPLRKAIPAEEILGLLLGLEGPIYARGAEAVRQWFADLVKHETALPEAVREAWFGLVGQLTPESMAERAVKPGLVGKISRAHRLAAQWEAYEDFFRNELEDTHLSFRRLFVPRFSEAYSDAIGGDGAPKKGKRRN